jgi:hypothetical protein
MLNEINLIHNNMRVTVTGKQNKNKIMSNRRGCSERA